MPTWLRSVAGILAGGLQILANGADWKHVLYGLSLAALGVVSHLTSTSDAIPPAAGTSNQIARRVG